MNEVRFEQFGRPHEVLHVAPQIDPGPPRRGEARLGLLYAPLHPSDLNMVRGVYGIRPALPASAGQEGSSRVLAVGDDVTNVSVGDIVLTPSIDGTWRDVINVPADRLWPLPAGVDPRHAALLVANPLSALLMLTAIVSLESGAWIIHNAASSTIGRCIVGIAHHLGLHTVSVVRRPDATSELQALGGDVVLVDDDDLPARVHAATGGAPIALGLEAVGGAALSRLLATVEPAGTIVIYAAVSGEPFIGSPRDLIYGTRTITGFWIVPWLRAASAATLIGAQQRLVELLHAGALTSQVHAIHPLEHVDHALADVRSARGKVLLAGSLTA